MKRLHKKLDFPFRRALAVLLAAAMTFALTGCSVRELHIGQVEVNTGAGTAWITPARGVDRFDIPAADFSAGADGSVTYTGTAYRVLQGIDVSTFQQDIDWQAVADSGIAFAVIRAGYRGYGKGGIVEDDRFRQNVAGACAAGLRGGLDFFSQAVTPEGAAEEAPGLGGAARRFKNRNAPRVGLGEHGPRPRPRRGRRDSDPPGPRSLQPGRFPAGSGRFFRRAAGGPARLRV